MRKSQTSLSLERADAWVQKNWTLVLVGLAIVPILLLLLQGLALLFSTTAKVDGDLADVLLKYLAGALVCLLLARVGPMLKGKFFGVELEFQEVKTVADSSIRLAAEVEKLRADIDRIRSTLDAGIGTERLAATELSIAAEHSPPVLPPVTVADDPNKGRFGGLATRDGYVLSASFSGAEEARVVSIELSVKGVDRILDRDVRFFLHPTFPRPELTVKPRGGIATVDTLAYGGFTVGVWIEGTETLLELDLSQLSMAPRIVREA